MTLSIVGCFAAQTLKAPPLLSPCHIQNSRCRAGFSGKGRALGGCKKFRAPLWIAPIMFLICSYDVLCSLS
jgi:hypothetical protein